MMDESPKIEVNSVSNSIASDRIIRWGILGLGKIARIFAEDLDRSSNTIIQAVASRDAEKAETFKKSFKAEKAYGSYAELVADPAVEIIYIATPHVFHRENTLLCLEAGKAVLCEKPMGINAEEVRAMIDKAREVNLFLMEGIWTRFMPAIEKTLSLLGHGVIGQLLELHADFGFRAPFNPDSRLFNKKLGGGSLLDIGIYPLYLSLILLGNPEDVQARAEQSDNGVDLACSINLGYKEGARAILESSFIRNTPTEALVRGTKGSIYIHRRFHQAEKITLTKEGRSEVFQMPFTGNGYVHEIEEVNQCLREGRTESQKLPLALSLELSRLLDRVSDCI